MNIWGILRVLLFLLFFAAPLMGVADPPFDQCRSLTFEILIVSIFCFFIPQLESFLSFAYSKLSSENIKWKKPSLNQHFFKDKTPMQFSWTASIAFFLSGLGSLLSGIIYGNENIFDSYALMSGGLAMQAGIKTSLIIFKKMYKIT